MPDPVVVAIVGVAVSILALAYTVVAARRANTTQLADRLARLAERLAKLETQVDVFWRGVTYDAARALHSPHPEFARRDHLLERFMAGTLTGPEMRELVAALSRVREDHDATAGERLAAGVVLSSIEAQLLG